MKRSRFVLSLGLAALVAEGAWTSSSSLEDRWLFERRATAATDPVAPQPMQGPFPSLEHWCDWLLTKNTAAKSHGAGPEGEGAHYHSLSHQCRIDEPAYRLPPDKLTAPYRDVRVVSFSESGELGSKAHQFENFYLAVQLSQGFWVSSTLHESHRTKQMQDEVSKITLDLSAPGPGGARMVVLNLATKHGFQDMNGDESEELVLAGVGPSGKPRATPPLLLKLMSWTDAPPWNAKREGREVRMNGAELDFRFLPDGTLELTEPTRQIGTGIPKEALRGLSGKHGLRFP